jgi:hypothetical protein
MFEVVIVAGTVVDSIMFWIVWFWPVVAYPDVPPFGKLLTPEINPGQNAWDVVYPPLVFR